MIRLAAIIAEKRIAEADQQSFEVDTEFLIYQFRREVPILASYRVTMLDQEVVVELLDLEVELASCIDVGEVDQVTWWGAYAKFF